MCSIIGGYVVRDASVEELTGHYVYGDFCSSQLHTAVLSIPDAVADGALAGTDLDNQSLVSFGEDACGRIYAVQRRTGASAPFGPGRVLRLEDGSSSCGPAQAPPPGQPPATTPSPRSPGPPLPASPAPDLRSPLLRLRTGLRQRPLHNHGVIVRLSCDEPCSYGAYGRLDLRRQGRKIALRQRLGKRSANRPVGLSLRLSKPSARLLRSALRNGRRVRARVLVRVRDEAGNLSKSSRLVRLTG